MDTPYQHGQQHPTIDMLAVYGGAKEFSGDGFSFDMAQLPPSGQPLLSGTEQDLMTDFFTHPDDFSEHVAFGYYKAPTTGDADNSSMSAPASLPMSDANANTLHNGNVQYSTNFNLNPTRNNIRNSTTFSARDINGMATSTREAMSQNDVAAATTLSGFRNNPSGDNATPFALDGASWGAMSMSGLTNDTAATYANDRQWLHNSTPRTNNTASPLRDGNGNLIEMVMGGMQRGKHVSSPQQNSSSTGGRPFGTYGSDTNFSSGNFTGTAPVDHTHKIGSLLGIPYLAQVAESPSDSNSNSNHLPVRTHSVNQEPGGHTNYATQFTPQYSASWNKAVMGSQSIPSKRRKSNSANGVKQEPNSDDDEAAEASKRRKSMAMNYQPTQAQNYNPSYPQMQPPQTQYPQGPMMLPPQDMRRPPTRKKENLTDDQKRANHIISEKKRREIINQGYRDLNDLTPALAMGKSGLSRSECLTEINNYLFALQLANTRLIKDLQLEPTAFALPTPASQNSLY